jgi:hypothetical protein
MSLIDSVAIEPRFQRAVRIDTDLGNAEALRGFICPPSSVTILRLMAQHVADTGQAAFTWTGPYGSGKSSLVIALSALMNGNVGLREEAAGIIGGDVAEDLWSKLPPKKKGWRILGIVGRKDDPVAVFGEAIVRSGLASEREAWTETAIIDLLNTVAAERPEKHGGLIVFVDEMGKMLEAAARGHGDVHLLQQVAELASRSGGRLLFVGILHQAFDEYAAKLSRDLRDEWTKIHGRFVDLPVNVGAEEQIAILSRAINGSPSDGSHIHPAIAVAASISSGRPESVKSLADLLAGCWPLHPATAALLGPISRRRFGQNQRSIFGFLNSAEPFGFREFLRSASEGMFTPDRLWDYLRVNLEPAILSSPDGHRWAVAAEAIDRCSAMGGDERHLRLLKAVAVIDLFRERSGLVASEAVIGSCFPGEDLAEAMRQLVKWSIVVFKKFIGAYAVYAGSDFDIEAAIEAEVAERPFLDMALVRSLSGLQPVLCKSHYHRTGALRWFDMDIVLSSGIEKHCETYRPAEGTIGQFVLVVPDGAESTAALGKKLRGLGRNDAHWDMVFGVANNTDYLLNLAREVQALGRVRAHPDLQGDPVARREVSARLAAAQGMFETEVNRAFEQVTWYSGKHPPEVRPLRQVSRMASEFADARYVETPVLHNELLNRIKPSSNAVAAQNVLLKRIVSDGHRERLGIEGYPAEGGLYLSLLARTGLHVKVDGAYGFHDPRSSRKDPARLGPLWNSAEKYLKANHQRSVPLSEIYDLWAGQPFGVKRGVMPVLAIAFMMTVRASLAFYRTSIFQPFVRDIDIDYLVKDPSTIQLRWMDLKEDARELLSGLAGVVRDIDRQNALMNLEPIDVGRGLVAIYDRLSPWTKRTQRLSSNAAAVRGVFKKASDPNGLIFNDLPGLFAVEGKTDSDAVIANVREGLEELVSAHPDMLHRLRSNLLAELQVPNASPKAIADLRARGENIRDLAGDFQLEAFVGRIATLQGTDEDVEGLASLAANRPMRDWSDADIDRAAVGLADLARRFNKAEAFAHVKGRKDKREAMAFVVNVGGRSAPVMEEFDVSEAEGAVVDGIIDKLSSQLAGSERKLILAAITRYGARLVTEGEAETDRKAVG